MTAKRPTLSRWSFPRPSLLREVFPSGKPPFAPFPTITDLLNAEFCPVAILHSLLHGRDYALLGGADFYEIKKRGELFDNFISHLKLALMKGKLKLSNHDISTQESKIVSLFHPFSKPYGFNFNACSEIWSRYIGPWVRRKLENKELQNILADRETFFELSIGNSHIQFPYENGKRSYPLRGIIDEIDMKRKRIIERTIKEASSDDRPPTLKDYQVWLLWKILCSLKGDQLPSQWNSVNFEDFDLVVETPHKDFTVSHENPDYVERAHSAFAWIHDVSISESPDVIRQAYEKKVCTPLTPKQECGLIRTCYPGNYGYPECRSEIKQTFKPWYQYLLWERIWKGDLFQYQLLGLEKEELIEKGLILEGRIVSLDDNKIELEMGREIGSARGYNKYTIIPFGTLFCGEDRKAKLLEVKGNRLIMEIQNKGMYPLKDAILYPSSLESFSPLLQEPPTFLEKQKQTGLLKLQQSGAIKEEKAKHRSWIQLLEAFFGTTRLKRSSK